MAQDPKEVTKILKKMAERRRKFEAGPQDPQTTLAFLREQRRLLESINP